MKTIKTRKKEFDTKIDLKIEEKQRVAWITGSRDGERVNEKNRIIKFYWKLKVMKKYLKWFKLIKYFLNQIV